MHGVTFHRPARTYPERLPTNDITVAAPPPLAQASQGAAAWLQLLLPILGGSGSLVFFVVSPTKSPIMLVVIGLVLMASIGGGILMRVQQGRSAKQQIKNSRAKYLGYIEQVSAQLRGIAQRQQRVNGRLYPSEQELAANVRSQTYLWERRASDLDFLHVRIGTGVVPLCCAARLETSTSPLTEYDQACLNAAQATIAKYSHLENAPIVVPLRTIGTLAVSGDLVAARALMRAIICQIAVMHAPEDVRLLAYFPPEARNEWDWLKWLPHARRIRQAKVEKKEGGDPLCLLAESVEDFQGLLAGQIVPELERRRKLSGEGGQATQGASLPHFLVLLDGFTPGGPLARIPAVEDLFRHASALGVTVACLVQDRSAEPSSLQARLQLSPAGWLTYEEASLGGQRREAIAPDQADIASCERSARNLAPLILSEKGAQRDLSQDMRLLELLGIPSADDVDTTTAWRPRTREDLLRVPIGISADGSPLLLDLKEAAEGGMGVHGLVIGATGSGKSELLRTLVTSLAITHDPETVNFVLADFKGGAAFADLATLPHAAGMISNLQSDLSLVDRMQAALTGEQERRQRMLREAGNLDNIRQYHIKRQSYPAMEPLPYLLIIVDEFAELLASKPDFLDVFVAIGRVGRSLGMHLLLATQRLSEGRIQGLEGHLRYRICLRTFSASESSSVIGTPDAFYLPSFPGIGYFKVDTNIYRQFKTALVSNPYVPATQTATASVTLREFSPTGRLIAIARAAQGGGDRAGTKPGMASASDELKTDMDVIITRLLKARDPNDRAAVHQVWLPPLSASVSLSDVLARCDLERLDGREWPAPPLGTLRIPIGLLDKPAEQSQEPLILDFSSAGGHLAIAGAPQSGKSTLLQAIVASFAVTHSPRDVQLYCIDMGGGQLRAFETAPHVGAVCGKMERDKVRRVVRQMRSLIEAREYLFHERRIDGMPSFRARRQAGELADVPFGDVFLVIDDLAQLQSEFDGLDAELIDIVASGLTYGVHVIVASNRWPDIRPKLRDNIGTRIELRLNEPSESEIGKKSAETLQGVAPGRGLVKGGLQFQVALPRVDTYDGAALQPLSAAIQAFVERMRAAWTGPAAPPVRMLPQLVTPDDLLRPGVEVRAGVPIGLEEFQLEPIYLDLATMGPHFLIFGDSECGKTSLLYAWMRGLEQRYLPEQVQFGLVDFRRNLVDLLGSPMMFDHGYACTPQMIKDLLDRLKGALDARMLSGANVTIEDLRKVGSWNGPHYYLFVDDYEALVTPAGSPLAPLADLIQQGRDVGLHVVLARRVSGTTRTAFEPVFQRLKESGSPGLVMSGDPQEGVLVGTQRAAELPPGRGYLVRRNQRTALVQTVFIGR